LYQEVYIEALHCYERWKPETATFSTFLFICVDNFLRSYAGKWNTKQRLPAFQVPLDAVDYELSAELSPSHSLDLILQTLYREQLSPDPIIQAIYGSTYAAEI